MYLRLLILRQPQHTPEHAAHINLQHTANPIEVLLLSAENYPEPLEIYLHQSYPSLPGLKRTQTATIPSPHSLAAILSPSAPPEDSAAGASRSSTPKRTHADAFSSADQLYLHPASPTQHRSSIALTSEPSPGTRGADEGSGGGMLGGQEEKKPAKMVRSSIACSRCRRSKVKCVNTGVNSTCKACLQSSRECTYPPTGSSSTPKRSEPTPGIKQEGDGESKKRIRKIEDPGRRNSQRTEDPLESPVLTRKVWDEVYDIFKLNFSTEMPFLHPPTFRNRMRQASFPRDPSISTADLDGRVLLLGVLTLTARFHPALVAHHSHANEPLAASEYYATALKTAFGPTGKSLTSPSLDGIQGLLMLGLYEWGQTRGLSAWVYVGIAMRLAQSMGLAYEDDPASQAFKVPSAILHGSRKAPLSKLTVSPRDVAIEKEVRRRTLWSCFIMDRMLSAGKYRPTMISAEKLRVQLPCSDDQFLFVHKVETGFLNSAWLGNNASLQAQNASVNDDGVLSRYIKLVEIFGTFSEWSYAGGRRTETLPPWDPSTEFSNLRQQLEDFHAALPSNLTFTEANLSAHIEKRNATTYASMHTLYSLCLIMLHREYIPFIPLRCDGPQGPLDAPTFPTDKFEAPAGFWKDSAEEIFKAARNIVDIVRTCQDNDALPESPQIGFAIWQAAFVSLYAFHFPWMDTAHYLQDPALEAGRMNVDIKTGYAAITAKLLGELVPRLRMVKGYQRTIEKMHYYFRTVTTNYVNFEKGLGREPFHGGGLTEYKGLEKELKEFGSLEDAERPSDGSDTLDPPRSRASTNDPGPSSSVNGEPMQGIEAASVRPHGAWAPINATSPPVEAEDRSKYNQNSGSYQYPVAYQQSPSSNAPSLISHSNGDSTSGLNSPYANSQGPPFHGSNQQPQHAGTYPSMAQHTQANMPPPTTQTSEGWPKNEASYEEYMSGLEKVRINYHNDNFNQERSFDEVFDGNTQFGPQFGNPNFITTLWGAPQASWGPPVTASWGD